MATQTGGGGGHDGRLLTLTVLADETAEDYELVRFEGREALSEPFEYRLEVLARDLPASLSGWVGKPVEFVVSWQHAAPRKFAGRIYEARIFGQGGGVPLIGLTVRPAYWATSYARGTHFIQDRSSVEIFDAITANVPGLTVDKSASGATKRPYAVRYDESELEFLDRLLAQDGIFYFFVHDGGGGSFRHRMKLANAPGAYLDVPGDPVLAFDAGEGIQAGALSNRYRAVAGTRRYHGFEVSKLDTPMRDAVPVSKGWGVVYSHSHEELSGAALDAGQANARGKVHTEATEQAMEVVAGSSDQPGLFAGGRVAVAWSGAGLPRKVVLTSVEHSAFAPSVLGKGGGQASYSNSFTAIDATLAFRPPVPSGRRRAYGPVLGVVKSDSGAEGEVVVDDRSRVPVAVSQVLEEDANKPFPQFVWLPVTQQWAHGTHGAQFLPRIGTRVMVDFLYGDPDLPFVAGSFYTPTATYPFDPASKATQTGWRSKTNKNGKISQEFLFEDKPGSEEIYLYTGRDYRRVVDNDETGTVKHDRTITVEHDHIETVKNDQTVTVENDRTVTVTNDHAEEVKHDQSVTVGNDQSTEVSNNRAVKVTGAQETTVAKTRTATVTQKDLIESKQEIELKVGQSSIKLTAQGIVIKAPTIKIDAQMTLDVAAGIKAQVKAPMVQVNADATLILKGGIVLIN